MAFTGLAAIIPLDTLLRYLGAFFIVGIAAMGADKASAMIDFDRISERDLSLIALPGGFTGIIVGGVMLPHKTSKPDFWVRVAVAAIVWSAFLIVCFFAQLLTLSR